MSNKYFVKKQCGCGVEEGARACGGHTEVYDKETKKWKMEMVARDAWRYEDKDNGLLVRGCCIRCWDDERHTDEQQWGDGRQYKGLVPLWDTCECECCKSGGHCDRSIFKGFYYTQRRIARCPKYLYPQFKMEAAHKKNMAEIEMYAQWKNNRFDLERRTGTKLLQHIIHSYIYISKSEEKKKWGEALRKNKRVVVANKGHQYCMRMLSNQTAEEVAAGGDVVFRGRLTEYYFKHQIKDAIRWCEFGALYDECIDKDNRGEISICDDVLSLIRSYVV